MRLLDLFSGAGGAARGYQLAGFYVVGIDNRPMPRYAGDVFVQADALEYLAVHGHEFDVIHASPPCQRYSRLTAQHRGNHQHLLPAVAEWLQRLPGLYVIENVPDAACYMRASVVLCGTMFGLPIHRHRLFETNAPNMLMTPPCAHIGHPVLITGCTRVSGMPRHEYTKAEKQAAIGINWMTIAEMDEAIPPAYTEWLGQRLLELL